MVDIYWITVKANDGDSIRYYRYEAFFDDKYWWSLERGYKKRVRISLNVVEKVFVRRTTKVALKEYSGANHYTVVN